MIEDPVELKDEICKAEASQCRTSCRQVLSEFG